MKESPNEPDAAIPAMAPEWHIGSQWRLIADLGRSGL
jgi:hypothetical protein